jgi:hypothetical protein
VQVTEAPTLSYATPAAQAPGRDVSAAGLLLSAVALGCALQVNFGQFHMLAIAWLTAALAGCAVSVVGVRSRLPWGSQARALIALGVGLAVQFALLLSRSPGATGALEPGWDLTPFRVMVVAAGVFAAGAMAAPGIVGRASLWAMLLVHAGIGLWVLRAAPDPRVDVITFQREACQALVAGQNPYAITFENRYPTRFYGPDLIGNGRLLFGFPYPPVSLLLVLPGYALGDIRYAHWAAMTLAGALVAYARPGRVATGAAALLLFTPRGFFVLEAGWTEPFAVLLLAATVFVACRRPRLLWLPLGLLIAVKQYLVLGLVLAPLLTSRHHGRWALAGKALAVAAAVTLPFVLWDGFAFVNSAVLLQFRQPFRDDALSYLAMVFDATRWRPPGWIGFVVVVPAIALVFRKCSLSPAGFAAGLALVCFVFFAFNKQAFCNYYYFVIAALCCAAGASETTAEAAVLA